MQGIEKINTSFIDYLKEVKELENLLYSIEPYKISKSTLLQMLKNHSEIKFVSLVGIDLAGNATDEKIPVKNFYEDFDLFLKGNAVQTDGSSVVLTGIATLNDARVDMSVDADVKWRIDYNYDNVDIETGKPIGTLRIPAFLTYNGKRIDSRSILKKTLDYCSKEMLVLLRNKNIAGLDHINTSLLQQISFTIGIELEFWVKTPAEKADIAELSVTQVIQENYWRRTRGKVKTALEQSLQNMELYELKPEMGHKEVGGIKAQMGKDGELTHVMEQLEIDWRFDEALQAADNEREAKNIIKDTFRANGLEVIFQAKPINGVAGNGKHIHFGIIGKLKDGKTVNLFSPTNMKTTFMSAIGYGAIMGILKNYEIINPFITCTNDSLNRLKPGFEAPICIATSLGRDYLNPSRNRTVLLGLVRDIENVNSTRFELRSPNPYTNTYITISAILMTMLDGIKYAVNFHKSLQELEKELSKNFGDIAEYLEKDRMYRSEKDVFDDYSPEERNKMFSKPPETVWESINNLNLFSKKKNILTAGNGGLSLEIIEAFSQAALLRWKIELLERIIPEWTTTILKSFKLHNENNGNDFDDYKWNEIQEIRLYLLKDTLDTKCLFTRICETIEKKDYALASQLQINIKELMEKLVNLYEAYKKNIIDSK